MGRFLQKGPPWWEGAPTSRPGGRHPGQPPCPPWEPDPAASSPRWCGVNVGSGSVRRFLSWEWFCCDLPQELGPSGGLSGRLPWGAAVGTVWAEGGGHRASSPHTTESRPADLFCRRPLPRVPPHRRAGVWTRPDSEGPGSVSTPVTRPICAVSSANRPPRGPESGSGLFLPWSLCYGGSGSIWKGFASCLGSFYLILFYFFFLRSRFL